jgi:hypothetical protein
MLYQHSIQAREHGVTENSLGYAEYIWEKYFIGGLNCVCEFMGFDVQKVSALAWPETDSQVVGADI